MQLVQQHLYHDHDIKLVKGRTKSMLRYPNTTHYYDTKINS